MGHSHYFNHAPRISAKWEDFVGRVRAVVILAMSGGMELSDGRHDFAFPAIDSDRISLNGVGEDGCETLTIEREGWRETWYEGNGVGWRFVKTYHRPYDAAVCAILAIGKHLGILSKVSSDGNARDWEPGLALAREVMGADVPLPFDE